jgi:hypothetical protein
MNKMRKLACKSVRIAVGSEVFGVTPRETRESGGPLGLRVKISHLSEGSVPPLQYLTGPHYEKSFSG